MEITISAAPNHAGTTPMDMRHDALVAASSIITRIPDLASSIDDGLTATVGRFDISPNIYNVIPGEAVFTVDVRHAKKKYGKKPSSVSSGSLMFTSVRRRRRWM
ncbi:peptidase dimerization domain-containing protein [Bacillus sonorensis]|nr:peptidase dimerization domain-containing protein [Bacillus sonorensis]